MKTIKTLVILFATSLLSINSNAQSKINNPEEKSQHALGVALGMSTGYGVSYRYTPNKFSAQLTFTPNKREDEFTYVTGLSFYYKIVDNSKIDFFIYEANSFVSKRYINEIYEIYPYYGYKEEVVNEDYFNFGFGFGFEFLIKDRMTFNLMGGYGAFESFDRISPTIETSLFYNF